MTFTQVAIYAHAFQHNWSAWVFDISLDSVEWLQSFSDLRKASFTLITTFGLNIIIDSLCSTFEQRLSDCGCHFIVCQVFKLVQMLINVLNWLVRKSLLVRQKTVTTFLKWFSALDVHLIVDYVLVVLKIRTRHIPISIWHQAADPLIKHSDLLLVITTLLWLLVRKRWRFRLSLFGSRIRLIAL